MRVFRFILRFLGISSLIIWIISSLAFGEDNVSVNFPDQMNVTGNVSITNLGINGDPQYNYSDEFQQPNVGNVNTSQSDNINTLQETYISSFDTWSFFSVNPNFGVENNCLFNIRVPVFDWNQIKTGFRTALYGTKFGSNPNSPTNNKILPSITGGAQNFHFGSQTFGHTIVTDTIGNGNWSMDFDWAYFVNGHQSSGNNIFVSWDISILKTALTSIISLLMWYEVVYSIIGIVSKA